ncbi:unnamed protein product [Phytomonas sp. Hart1]|nr:unnamed protein product [Phytomonas sp. Hart1]|eukprot:CCW71939.1 unnamed protein product [Phytomonas sp. isolate Hart1]
MEKKVALITGANKGIGFSTANKLAELGYKVLVGARNPERGMSAVAKLKESNLDAHLVVIDLENRSTITSAVNEVTSRYQRLDVLVNNAAIFDFDNHILPIDLTRHRHEMEVNYFATVELTNEFLPLLLRAPDGPRVVFVSTPLASHRTTDNPTNRYGHPTMTSYKCSKSALNMYAHNLAIYLQRHCEEAGAKKAKVNCCYPGYVRTDMSLNTDEAPLLPDQGAETSVYLATLGADGPTGGFFHQKESIPW